MHEMAEQLGKKIAEAEKHGEEGNVEKSMEIMAEVEETRKNKIGAEVRILYNFHAFICGGGGGGGVQYKVAQKKRNGIPPTICGCNN